MLGQKEKRNNAKFYNLWHCSFLIGYQNNEYFDSDNGILYTEGFKKIIMIPYKHPDEVISLHDGVEETEEQFAGYLTNVKKIIIPEGLKSLNHNSFSNSKS